MDYPMTPVIAARLMKRTRADGIVSDVIVEIGTPLPVPAGSPIGGWYCTLRFVGVPIPDIYTFYGEDAVQALASTLVAPGVFLRALPFANEIDFSPLPTFGFPQLPARLQRGSILSGTVTLENCNDPRQNVTFEFRPKNGTVTPDGNPVVIRQVLTQTGTNTGTFQLEGIPNGTYDIAIKAYSWLRKVIPNVVVNGSNISNLNVTLLGGDVNNTNAVDIGDLTQVIGHYNTLGDP